MESMDSGARRSMFRLATLAVVCSLCSQANAQGCPVPQYPGVSQAIIRWPSAWYLLFYCPADKELRGVGFKVCKAGKNSWSNQHLAPRCENANDCPVLVPPPNGHYNSSGPHRYLDALQLVCKRNYTLVNASTAKCRLRGWSSTDLGSCMKLCPLPIVAPPVAYQESSAPVAAGKAAVGTTLRFSCNAPGMRLNGHKSSECLDSSQWSAPAPTCKARVCRLTNLFPPDALDSSSNLVFTPNRTRFLYNEEVRVDCERDGDRPRYLYPDSASYFHCSADAHRPGRYLIWTGDDGRKARSPVNAECRSYCHREDILVDPGTASYLDFSAKKARYRVNETLTAGCSDGREVYPRQSRNSTCASSTTGSSFWLWQVGSKRLSPLAAVACRATYCEKPPSTHRLLEVNAANLAPSTTRFRPHFSVAFSCGQHNLIGSRFSACVRRGNDLEWLHAWPTCELRPQECPALRAVHNGRFTRRGPLYTNATVGLQCDRCYKPTGRVTTQCRGASAGNASRAAWTPDISRTTCQIKTCPEIRLRSNLFSPGASGGPTHCGTVLQFHCSDGYSLLGETSIECLDTGSWSGCVPKCVRTRCTASLTCTGQTTCEQVVVGRTVHQRCACIPADLCPECPEMRPMCWPYGTTVKSMCHLRAKNCTNRVAAKPVAGACVEAGVCSQPRPVARAGENCNAQYERWYFNTATARCVSYLHGLCYAGSNSFRTETECKRRCARAPDPCTEEPHVGGPCIGDSDRYSFVAKKSSCTRFGYYGCGGNGNNFRDRVTCERLCKMKADGSRPAKSPCSGMACPNPAMSKACPVDDPNVFAIKARVVYRHDASAKDNLTQFSVIVMEIIHRPEHVHVSAGFHYYPLWRYDGGDDQCGCPDLSRSVFYMVGSARQDDPTRSYFTLNENSHVEDEFGGNAGDFRRRLHEACPHLQYSVPSA